ncbi:MAG: zinc ribbon domain-containing protein [Clostridiales bacterium]|nr:zinc ribbon domain-containing protein [Clostridiales bacterium]MDY2920161.1 zinc ribbon domain-containing protein [Lentihominibacter sp.]
MDMNAIDIEVKKDLDELYRELGAAYYEMSRECPPEELRAIFEEIDRLTEPQERRCPYCGTVADEDAMFCINCGKMLGIEGANRETSNKCPNCGNTLSEGASFCGMCGSKIE